ncbi:hypothetical protein FVEG_11638 [Fusarium verticillioides 7600]|uniref:Uncharacterized protein n=1 Tax=Gibberella moniliformis (strain M3125 / FGSC 7600) TaxID=334819 RepID=W7MNX2_GIBM7|nr:hypothetical protein FVEG_11638 [Fusarium verticillioides 7600]EWG53153.1 hypothetical protein FVEG_11638 [Fusarium verticillioides 7600]
MEHHHRVTRGYPRSLLSILLKRRPSIYFTVWQWHPKCKITSIDPFIWSDKIWHYKRFATVVGSCVCGHWFWDDRWECRSSLEHDFGSYREWFDSNCQSLKWKFHPIPNSFRPHKPRGFVEWQRGSKLEHHL